LYKQILLFCITSILRAHQLFDIISPTNGIVKIVRVTTIGGVLRQGDELMQILPTDSDLVVEAKVKPADMAMIKTGLAAKVKLDGFDYSIFGSLQGEVSYVSSDSLIEDSRTGPITYYRIKVDLTQFLVPLPKRGIFDNLSLKGVKNA